MTHIYKILSTLALLALAVAAWVWVMRPVPVVQVQAEYYLDAKGAKVELHKWEDKSPVYEIEKPKIK